MLDPDRSASADDGAATGIDLPRVARLSEQYLASVEGDAAHDTEHIRRVVANATRLARAEGASLDVVVPAAWLHDCVSVPKDSPDRPRASALAAAEAVRLLRDWDLPADLLPPIAHAIEAHSFSAGIATRTREAAVLQDADRLDALGAIGLARCVMLGAELGRPLYLPDDPFCEQRQPDDLASSVDHFYTKLLGLPASFQTAAGREEAKRRTEILHQFLSELRHELGWAG